MIILNKTELASYVRALLPPEQADGIRPEDFYLYCLVFEHTSSSSKSAFFCLVKLAELMLDVPSLTDETRVLLGRDLIGSILFRLAKLHKRLPRLPFPEDDIRSLLIFTAWHILRNSQPSKAFINEDHILKTFASSFSVTVETVKGYLAHEAFTPLSIVGYDLNDDIPVLDNSEELLLHYEEHLGKVRLVESRLVECCKMLEDLTKGITKLLPLREYIRGLRLSLTPLNLAISAKMLCACTDALVKTELVAVAPNFVEELSQDRILAEKLIIDGVGQAAFNNTLRTKYKFAEPPQATEALSTRLRCASIAEAASRRRHSKKLQAAAGDANGAEPNSPSRKALPAPPGKRMYAT